MPDCAGNLTLVLESDLLQAGWNRQHNGDISSPIGDSYQWSLEQQYRALVKKFYGALTDEQAAEDAALALFLQSNEDCRTWVFSPCSVEVEWVVAEAQAIIDNFFHPSTSYGPRTGVRMSFGAILQGIGFGKGVNQKVSNVDFYSKLAGMIRTSTNIGLVELLDQAFPTNQLWRSIFKSNGETKFGVELVAGAVLAFADKNADIKRVIASEALYNMLLQKGQEAVYCQGLREVFGIDFKYQPDKNRNLARIGSRDGSFCTIDLKSASDRNSVNMVRKMFVYASEALRWLEQTRSPYTVIPGRDTVPMHMMSSMGNATTFPLQTLIFASVVVASYKVLGIKPEHPKGQTIGNYGVFGDDIVCVPAAYQLICDTLQSLGHIVNHDKSFNKGPFRESCGTDWYSGRDVRGVYIKALNDRCDIYSAINRLNVWSARHGVPLVATTEYLLSLLSDEDRKILVPMHEADTAGICVPEDFVLKRSYWHTTYGRSYRSVSIQNYKVDLSSERAFTLEMHKARQIVLKHRSGKRGAKVNAKVKYLAFQARYDADVHFLSALRGSIQDRSGNTPKFVIREFGRRTVVKKRHSSCWNYVPPARAVRCGGEEIHLLTRVNLGILDPNMST